MKEVKLMNNTIFNSYLTGEERAEAIEESKYDLIFSRADMLFEMVELRLAQNIKEAEFKVFSENGTYDDYQYYIEEAEAEAAQKKQSILGTIWNAIKKLIKTIGEKLASIKVDAGDENTEVEIEEDAITDNNAIAGALTSLKDASTAVNSNNPDPIAKANSIAKIAGIIGGITIGAGAAAGVAVKMVKKKKGELMGLKKTAEAALSDANNVATAADSLADTIDTGADVGEAIAGKNKASEGAKKVANAARELGSNIYNKIVKPIAEIVKKLARAIGTKAKDVGNKVLGKWHIANDEEKNKPEAKQVVADDTTDDKFDKSKQIKLSAISKKVPDAKVGDYVIKEMTSKSSDSNAKGDNQNGNQPANNNGGQKADANQTDTQNSGNNQPANNNGGQKADANQTDTQNSGNNQNGNNNGGQKADANQTDTQNSGNNQNTNQQPTNQNTNNDGQSTGNNKVSIVNKKTKGRLKVVNGSATNEKGRIGIDSSVIQNAINNGQKISVGNYVLIGESGEIYVMLNDENPFIEDADTSYDKYDLELSEIADMFRSL